MDWVFQAVAACREGLVHLTSSSGLALSLFLAGLGGSALHCAGMCGPFVLGQVMSDAGKVGPGRSYGAWRRLAGAALLPYHLGRMITYTALGAVAGAATALFASTAGFGWLSGLLLLFGAIFMLTQAFGLAIGLAMPQAAVIERLAAPLVASTHPPARFALGLVLGFLPCGLIYGALGAAAGTGSPVEGGLAMAAFSLGTMPALVAIGWGGALLRRRFQYGARWFAAPLLVVSSALMIALAIQRL
jgi:sulfite exporter TauE/SafE